MRFDLDMAASHGEAFELPQRYDFLLETKLGRPSLDELFWQIYSSVWLGDTSALLDRWLFAKREG